MSDHSTLSSSFRNIRTKLMKEIGYGKDYRYAHDYPEALVDQGYFPSELLERIYYRPTNRGHERIIKERLDKWRVTIQVDRLKVEG